MKIRDEEPADIAAIREVVEAAFHRQDEADLVDKLRADRDVVISLVALYGDELVGSVSVSFMNIRLLSNCDFSRGGKQQNLCTIRWLLIAISCDSYESASESEAPRESFREYEKGERSVNSTSPGSSFTTARQDLRTR